MTAPTTAPTTDPAPLSPLPPAAPAAVPAASWWEDFLDIFYAPRQVFERRRNAGFLVPLLVLTVLMVALVVAARPVLQPVYDAEMMRGMAAAARSNPAMTPERIDQARRLNEKLLPVYAGFATFLTPMLVGLVLWGAARALEIRLAVGAACMIATYAYIPRLLEAVLNLGQGYVMDPATLDGHYRLTLSPARFLDPNTTSPVVLAAVGRLDLFVIWVTVLLAIGLMVVARAPRARAATAAAIVYAVGWLPTLWQAIRSS